MKRIVFSVYVVFLASWSFALPIDVSIEARSGNQSFEADRDSSATNLPTAGYRFGGAAAAAVGISEDLEFVGEYERSTVFGNLTRLAFRHHDQLVSVSAGTVFGVANTSAVLLKPGVYTSIRFDIPGLLYARFSSERSLRVDPRKVGDYVMDSLDLAAGLYLPNAILSARIESQSREAMVESGTVLDVESGYFGEIDIFEKNVPYRVLVTFGYRDITKTFISDTTSRHTAGFLVLGTFVSADIGERVTYHVGVDSSVYTFGRNALIGEFANDVYVFRATTGVTIAISE